MYYRTPDNRRDRTLFPTDDVSVPENYSGNVFRTAGGKTTFTPLENTGKSLTEEPDTKADTGCVRVAGTPTEPSPEPSPISGKAETPTCAPGTPETDVPEERPDGEPYSLPKPPKFLEHFNLPQSFGSEELILLGLMYLTAQKPDDDLWVYLLILLFCG